MRRMAMELTKQGKNQGFELTDAQKQELDRRLESAINNGGQGGTWDEIKAEFMKSR